MEHDGVRRNKCRNPIRSMAINWIKGSMIKQQYPVMSHGTHICNVKLEAGKQE